MPAELQKRSILVGIAERVATGLFFFAVAAAWVGSTRTKVNQKVTTLEVEWAEWKQEWKAEKQHITTMDLEGSVATKNFVEHYNKEQREQYERLQRLEREYGHLETMQKTLDRLEYKIDDGRPRP